MSINQTVLEKLQELTPDKQREVLDFVEFLRGQKTGKQSRQRLKGLCADLKVHITEEDIADARRDMWDKFPREDM